MLAAIEILSKLNLFAYEYNKFTGTIPTQLGLLYNPFVISLSGNLLEGTIPTELGNIYSLIYLYLDKNQLTGSIPTELGQLSILEHLVIDNNIFLSGIVPLSISNIPSLREFVVLYCTVVGSWVGHVSCVLHYMFS